VNPHFGPRLVGGALRSGAVRAFAVALATVVLLIVAGVARGDGLMRVGELVASPGVTFEWVAESDGVAVASSDGAVSGAVDVYEQGTNGWGTVDQVAALVDSGGDGLGAPAISGDVVAVGDASGRVDLFTEPSGGWAGSVSPTATYTPPAGTQEVAVALSGRTLVVRLELSAGPTRQAVYVFNEPVAGWVGSLHPAATLVITTPYSASEPFSIDGTGVIFGGTGVGQIAVTPGSAEVFTEPLGGWTGTVEPVGQLEPWFTDTRSAWLFESPSGGWVGFVRPAARLLADGYPGEAAISGHDVAVAGEFFGSDGGCPCGANVTMFKEPAGGWSGTLSAPTLVTGQSTGISVPLALDGQTLFVGGQNLSGAPTFAASLDVFNVNQPVVESSVAAGAPSVSRQTYGNFADRHPTLAFELHGGTNAAPINSITLRLPTGLNFTGSRSQLRAGVAYCRIFAIVCTTSNKRLLRITTTIPIYYLGKLHVKLAAPAITESTQLAHQIVGVVRYNRSHHAKKRLRLRFALAATDVTGHVTHLTLTDTIAEPHDRGTRSRSHTTGS
jgi:hypothetical protein